MSLIKFTDVSLYLSLYFIYCNVFSFFKPHGEQSESGTFHNISPRSHDSICYTTAMLIGTVGLHVQIMGLQCGQPYIMQCFLFSFFFFG